MKIEITKSKLLSLLLHQLGFFLADKEDNKMIKDHLEIVLKRIKFCFEGLKSMNKYYIKEDQAYFNPLHSGQYCIFLYYFGNSIYRSNGPNKTSDKLYLLNKSLNACDLYYEIDLPDIFFLDHPVGSVLGRANYSDYFSFSQNCTVGNNHGIYPSFGTGVKLLSGAKVLGNCNVGDNVIVSANTYIKDQDISPNSIVFGSSPNLTIIENTFNY